REAYQLRTIFPAELPVDQHDGWHERTFDVLCSFANWKLDALQQLLQRPDRAAFNLPDEVQQLEATYTARAYLQLYVAAGHTARGERTYVAFVEGEDARPDTEAFFSQLVQHNPAILEPLLAVPEIGDADLCEKLQNRTQPIPNTGVLRYPHGPRQVLVHDAWLAKQTENPYGNLNRLGAYEIVENSCVQLWHNSVELRRTAAARKAVQRLNARQLLDRAKVDWTCQQVAQQLAVPPPALAELQTQAEQVKARKLLDFLAGLPETALHEREVQ
ncbi:MAG: hypothetical protein MUD01_24360, partial [Chloroflexaceae bacterium]|nr:hypothetical protein [Chloroflexaceae bacterium]